MSYKAGTKVRVVRNKATGKVISKTYTTSKGKSTTYTRSGGKVTVSHTGGGATKQRNPADVKAGIDASKTSYDPATGREITKPSGTSAPVTTTTVSRELPSGLTETTMTGTIRSAPDITTVKGYQEMISATTPTTSSATTPTTSSATKSSSTITEEQATSSGLNVVGGKIQIKTAGDWLKYARAKGMSDKEYSQMVRTYHPETSGDWLRLARKEKWKGKQLETELRSVYEPGALQHDVLKRNNAGGVISAGRTKPFTEQETAYKMHLESQVKKPTTISKKLSYAYSVAVKPHVKPAKEFYSKVSQKVKESHGYKHTFGALPSREQVQPYADKMGEFWKKIPDTSLSYHQAKDKEAFTLKATARKESQGEFIKGFVPAVVSYPREHPIKTTLFATAPFVGRVVGAGAKVVGGTALIKASPYLPITATKSLHYAGKGLAVGTKAGIGGLYIYDKKRQWEATTDPYSKGKFTGELTAETGLLIGGHYASSSFKVPWERKAEYLRGRIAVRTSPEYATRRSVTQVDKYAKLSQELHKVDIEPVRNYPFKEVKGISKKQIKGYEKFALSKDMEVIGGSGTQATYMKDPKLQQAFFKYKKIGDIDPITKTGRVPKALESVSDPHKYSERYVFRRSPFTKDIKYTPKGEPVYSFGEQSGRLFSGMTTQRDGAFYRAEKDSARLLFQYKVAETEGLVSPTAKESFTYVTEGYKKVPEATYFSKPTRYLKKTGVVKKTPQDIKFGDVEFGKLFETKPSSPSAPSPVTISPTLSITPSRSPSSSPSFSPSVSPSFSPSRSPSFSPSVSSSFSPSRSPSFSPSVSSSFSPSRSSSFSPSVSSSFSPSRSSSFSPSVSPSLSPSRSPSFSPSVSPSLSPSPRSPSFIPSPSVPPSITPSLFPRLPRAKFKAPSKPKKKKSLKPKYKYAPTLHASIGGIKQVGKKKGMFSGLAQRGI